MFDLCFIHFLFIYFFYFFLLLLQLLPDGPELIERFIAAEGDTSARRSAFLFLYNEAEELAIDFLNAHMEDVSSCCSCCSFSVSHLLIAISLPVVINQTRIVLLWEEKWNIKLYAK